MKVYFVLLFSITAQLQVRAEEFKSDFDLNLLDNMVKKDLRQASAEMNEREGVDGPWMTQLFVDYRKGKQVTNEELSRIWSIYESDRNHRVEDKLYAFSLICEFEDISKWQSELDNLALSEDPKFIKLAIDTVILKMKYGKEKEKILISNNTAILDRLVNYAETNHSDTSINTNAIYINEIAKPFIGKTLPVESKSAKSRYLNSSDINTRGIENKISISTTNWKFSKIVTNYWGYIITVVIAILITALSIWRSKSNSKPS